jgi:hypothetical protein
MKKKHLSDALIKLEFQAHPNDVFTIVRRGYGILANIRRTNNSTTAKGVHINIATNRVASTALCRELRGS